MIRLLVLMLLLSLCSSAYGAQDCTTINAAMDSAAQKAQQASERIIKDYVPPPDFKDLDNCLSSIFKFGSSFDLGVPQIGDLTKGACEALKSSADDRLRQLEQGYSVSAVNGLFSAGAKSSTNSSSSGINVKDTSSQIRTGIWSYFK